MGCGSVNKARVVLPNADLVLETTDLLEVDTLFAQAFDPLKQINRSFFKLKDSVTKFQDLCWVKLLRGCNLTDAVTVLLIEISLSLKGSSAIFTFIGERPYLRYSSDVPVECSELSNAFLLMLQYLTQTSNLTTEFFSSSRHSIQVAENFDFNILLAGTDFTVPQAARSVRACKANILRLKDALEKFAKVDVYCSELWELLKKSCVNFNTRTTAEYIRDLLRKTGDKYISPEVLVSRHWPDKSRLHNEITPA
mmetsp:Transcript_33273/g.58377  ORF Transcript_33273/g.58377 Transcript_33273/m.58377 type:complete len:252 (+) Transcript_33273:1257-2012(+)